MCLSELAGMDGAGRTIVVKRNRGLQGVFKALAWRAKAGGQEDS